MAKLIMPIIPLDKIEKFPDMIATEYEYKGFMFQRVTTNLKWHVMYDNHIVNIGTYRHDLEQWVDKQYKIIMPNLSDNPSTHEDYITDTDFHSHQIID